jgi:hypothetical protein
MQCPSSASKAEEWAMGMARACALQPEGLRFSFFRETLTFEALETHLFNSTMQARRVSGSGDWKGSLVSV